jgi:hypothetical protein
VTRGRWVLAAIAVAALSGLVAMIWVVDRYSGSFFLVHNDCPSSIEVSTSKNFDGDVWVLDPDGSLDQFPGSTEIWVRTETGEVYSANGAFGPLVDPGNITISGSACNEVSRQRY